MGARIPPFPCVENDSPLVEPWRRGESRERSPEDSLSTTAVVGVGVEHAQNTAGGADAERKPEPCHR
eukprot:scaffold150295_cov31-Tisochrysis_lutea.AAC.3